MPRKPIRFQINRVLENLNDAVDARIGEAALSSFSSIVIASPVKTGTFRGNWQVSLNDPIVGVVLDEQDLSGGSQTINKYRHLFDNYRLGKSGEASKIWFSNNMQYAKRLNEGHSKQARPAGFVQRGLRAGLDNVNAGGRLLRR